MHWMVHLEGGPRRVNHAAVVIGDHIYSFGGYCSGEVQCRNEPIDIHLLNTATYRWQHVPSNSDREAIARRRINSLKPSTSSSSQQQEDDDDYFSTHHNPGPTRRRARSVAELHPLGQLRYIRPAIDNNTNHNNNEETASNSSSSGRFSGLGDETDAIDSDELASMEVDDEESSSLSDIDEEAGQDSDYEDFPQARFVNPVAQPDAYVWLGGQQQLVGGASMQNQETQVPYQRYGHTVVAYEGKAYLWGGRNDEFGSSQLLHQYNPATNEWSVVKVEGMLPPSRDGHTAVMHNHTMFIFGGFEESNHRFSQETYAFDFKTNTWHQVNTQEIHRSTETSTLPVY